MKNTGYIALHRKIRDNFLWKEKRAFSKLEAWLDILMEAQYTEESREVMLGMKVLTCRYGQTLRSIESWAKRWNWSKPKVKRFFTLLEKEGMVETCNEKITTRLTVCNYGRYNDVRNANEPRANRKRTQ